MSERRPAPDAQLQDPAAAWRGWSSSCRAAVAGAVADPGGRSACSLAVSLFGLWLSLPLVAACRRCSLAFVGGRSA